LRLSAFLGVMRAAKPALSKGTVRSIAVCRMLRAETPTESPSSLSAGGSYNLTPALRLRAIRLS
jgi:hypothetical protein